MQMENKYMIKYLTLLVIKEIQNQNNNTIPWHMY